MFVKIIYFYPLSAELESLSEQSHHDHDYWSGVSCLKTMHLIQDMLVDLNIPTLYTIVNVHCFDFTVSFVCFQLVLSMFCNLLYVAKLRARYQQTWSRDPCEGWECLSNTGGLLESGHYPIYGIKCQYGKVLTPIVSRFRWFQCYLPLLHFVIDWKRML